MNKIVTIIYKVVNKIFSKTNWYNEFWNGATKFWRQNQFNLDVVNLGSGAGVKSFCYDGLNVKANNWALGPQSLVHDFNILKNYFSYIREGGVVIITICPFSCLVSKYDKHHNLKYYTFLHPATIIDFDDVERTKALKIKANPFKEMPFYCIKQTLKEILKRIKKIVASNKIDLSKSAEQIMNGWKQQFGITDLSAPVYMHHQEEMDCRRKTLEAMILFCKERMLKPIIVIPPMFHTLNSLFPKEFKENYMNKFLNKIDAPIYDYMNCNDFDDENLFETALFLNEHGAQIFTKKMLKDLKIIQNK